MSTVINQHRNAAVDQAIYWKSLDSCPHNVHCWLLTIHNKAIEGVLNDSMKHQVKGWYPFPNIPEGMK